MHSSPLRPRGMTNGPDVVLMTDHGSREGSRGPLEKAIEMLTGRPPAVVDARHFLPGRGGRVRAGELRIEVPSEAFAVAPQVLVIYEIPPRDRRDFAIFQRELSPDRRINLAVRPEAWLNATDKRRTVDRFRRAGVPQMESIALHRPDRATASEAFERLDGDVWTRPAVGSGGDGVFHVTTHEQLHAAAGYYRDQEWLLSRDARNFGADGRRHQFRVVVLDDRVLRVSEHVQPDPDVPCNASRGALYTILPVEELPPEYHRLAIAATHSLGLSFGGVDLAVENGGVVFEVNVHPELDYPGGLESVAIPFVAAHLR
jgi:glutathione synthase/RimK-type ligase-like ATP-grasp enzyme